MTFDPNARPAPDQPSYAALLRQLQEAQIENKQLKRTKKFGLVWEDKPDAQVERVFLEAPLLCEDRERAVVTDEDAVNHVLINGDNFHALTALRATHTGKVDVIYIDPPYNTGNKDFIYNDNYVDAEDGYRHSKWLTFMEKRLRLARELMSKKGVIFVSVDDNEQANLKLLMDKVFGSENFISMVPVINNQKGNNDQVGFAGTHEYFLAYSKSAKTMGLTGIPLSPEEEGAYNLEDSKGRYKKGANLIATGADGARAKRPSLFYPIFVSSDLSRVSPTRLKETDTEVKPLDSKGNEMRWRWSSKLLFSSPDELIVSRLSNGKVSISKKQRLEGENAQMKPKSVFSKPTYSGTTASNELKKILGGAFSYPKSVALIRDLISMSSSKNSIVLDFFAGSGTTAHAVAELNKADGGRRQCILVTDGGKTEETGPSGVNSKGEAVHIAEEITYERVRRVLTGKDWADGKEHEPLGGNLRYFNVHMENIQPYSERDEAAAFAPFTRSHASIATSAFTVVEEKRVDTVFGLPIDYVILSAPAGEDEVKYVVAVQAHDYELAELGEWFSALPEDADVTLMGHWLHEVEWVKENSARVKVLDVMEQVSASRKHAKSLVYT